MLADITHNLIDDTWDDKEIKNSGERDRRQTSEFAPLQRGKTCEPSARLLPLR